MVKVITYGTYDFLHYGHIKLLERAKALGDYLIVGVTADDFDKTRGKINVQQSLMERVEAVRSTGIVDEIIIEEYEGQKIDDIRRYDVDIFTVGSDWVGKFDYLNEYCKVVYLPRTEGISSTELRSQKDSIKLGLVGDTAVLKKIVNECGYVNGLDIVGVFSNNYDIADSLGVQSFGFDELLDCCDAVYIMSVPEKHYDQIKAALHHKNHVICESPISLCCKQTKELMQIAHDNQLILMDAIKTAYATAYTRLIQMVKAGKIGKIYSVDSTCTSLNTSNNLNWNSIYDWGPAAMLPIFQLLGVDVKNKRIATHIENGEDTFTKVSFEYKNAVASIKVGKGVKSEGELIISGTEGYIYVPAPWWKTDYYEIRYENQNNNKKFFYQLNGEGIRSELVAFRQAVSRGKLISNISEDVTCSICGIIEDFVNRVDLIEI